MFFIRNIPNTSFA